MDSCKKLVFPDQILSSRNKVLTRFGLGIAASLFVLSALLFINSFDSPFVSPLFRGFHGSSLNPSSSSSGRSSFFTSSSSSKQFQQRIEGAKPSNEVLEETHLGNLSRKGDALSGVEQGGNYQNTLESTGAAAKDERLVASDVGMAKTHLGNFSEEGKVSSFDVEKGVNDQNAPGANATSSAASNATLVSGKGSTAVEEKTQFGNFSEARNDNVTMVKSNVNDFSSDVEETTSNSNKNSFENCDIYDGKWVKVDDETMPYYPPGSCPYIDRDFTCIANGRPDDAFLKWKWQPNHCDIPRLNATDFLEKLKGKKLVFVGDSLNRNMWESLVCILRHSVKDKKRVYEISGRREFKKKGFYAFRFEDYDCTVDFVASPFLVRESSFKGKNGTFETLRLDLMDKTTSMYRDADILIFNTGHWWTHDKTKLGEDYYQEGNYVHPRLNVLEAYKRALITWARWVDKNIDRNQTHVIFRGYSVTHFRGGPWNLGGQCHNETEPIFDTKYLEKYPSKMRALEHVVRDMKTPVTYMNISTLTDFRKDGHPSIYRRVYENDKERTEAVKHQDCSHWCLPGVPDTWNELLYVSLLKAGIGSWRNRT